MPPLVPAGWQQPWYAELPWLHAPPQSANQLHMLPELQPRAAARFPAAGPLPLRVQRLCTAPDGRSVASSSATMHRYSSRAARRCAAASASRLSAAASTASNSALLALDVTEPSEEAEET
jgi:hypothetical protein